MIYVKGTGLYFIHERKSGKLYDLISNFKNNYSEILLETNIDNSGLDNYFENIIDVLSDYLKEYYFIPDEYLKVPDELYLDKIEKISIDEESNIIFINFKENNDNLELMLVPQADSFLCPISSFWYLRTDLERKCTNSGCYSEILELIDTVNYSVDKLFKCVRCGSLQIPSCAKMDLNYQQT